MDALIGIDVGTGSARAGVFDATGKLLASAKRDIRMWREEGDVVEQSTEDIWRACVESVREAMGQAGVGADSVRGLSFDATCSLAVVGAKGEPIAVGPSGEPQRNIIVWMDHRAGPEADAINATGDDVLSYVGGQVSPEMHLPKLLWLSRHKPDAFEKAAHFFDLTDYLTWRATESAARSACTVTCKFTYLAHEGRWSDAFLRRIGLGRIVDEGFARIGTKIVEPGTALGQGLSEAAAGDFGLEPGIAVGAGLIDAHAGGVGTIGGRDVKGEAAEPERRVAFITGTSNCTMAVSRDARFVPGIWGPYFSAMIPGLWLTEGGQSAFGAALDHLVRLHPVFRETSEEARRDGISLFERLERDLVAAGGSASDCVDLVEGVHVLPEFLGNRSPKPDPDARAVIAGLDLDASAAGLGRFYLAGLYGLAYGAADIVDAMTAKGYRFDAIVMSGGAARSALVRQAIADATGVAVVVPETPEPVLLGSAMLGAVAAGLYPSLGAAMQAMSRDASIVQPAGSRIATLHRARRRVFAAMQAFEREARATMAAASGEAVKKAVQGGPAPEAAPRRRPLAGR